VNSTKILNSKKLTIYFLFLFSTTFLCIKVFKEINPNDIKILGTTFITKDIIIKNSSLRLPKKLINIRTKLHEQELKKNLSLKHISINRQLFPFKLKIFLQIREPVAYAEKNNEKMSGYVDEEGFFINEEFASIKKDLPYQFKVIGWKDTSRETISKIIQAYKINSDLRVINISEEGYIVLEEDKFKKIFLGNQPKKIDLQLRLISDIRRQIIEKEFLNKIENLDLTDIDNPTLKVFKP
tara:strand:- start:347 stop:1063 length:717 start_codon:yes stop_codon:yes gene_type:complete